MNTCGTFKLLMTVISATCQTMQSSEQGFMSGYNLHTLFHVMVIYWVSQVSGFTHVKLTNLSMLVNLIDTWLMQHQ